MRSSLVHARLPDTFAYYAAKYAAEIFNVLPVKGARFPNGKQGTPYELFHEQKPRVSSFRVFGCPCVAKKFSVALNDITSTAHISVRNRRRNNIRNHTSQRGVRGIFIGFPHNQKGFQIYVPSTRQTKTSLDVEFDEHFKTAIAYNWKPFNDSLTLRPLETSSIIPEGPTEHRRHFRLQTP